MIHDRTNATTFHNLFQLDLVNTEVARLQLQIDQERAEFEDDGYKDVARERSMAEADISTLKSRLEK